MNTKQLDREQERIELIKSDPQKLEMLNFYCKNNLRELKKICDPIITTKNITDMYRHDLYDDAIKVLIETLSSFDSDKSKFTTFLTGNIKRSFYDWTRDYMRGKRCNLKRDKNGKIIQGEDGKPIVISDISLDAPTEDGIDLFEKIASEKTIESEVFSNERKISTDERVNKFLNILGGIKRQILELIIEGYSPSEIKLRLNISNKEYSEELKQIRSFKNIMYLKTLFNKNNMKENMEEIIMTTQTAEKSKPMQYSIAAINKKIENRTIRFDHPLQRESDQWSPAMKGNLISDILQGNPLPEIVFAEQIINGIPIIWDLDGKQRCTNCYAYANNAFKVSKSIRRWNIKYVSHIKDESGKPILDENGNPIREYKEFDIRNKKFSQLPEELQDRFLEYTFKCDQYLNCDNEEIAYHIIRYNEGKPMTKSQKGITRLGEEFASIVKSISAMPFFRETGSYTVKEANNGTLDRVVVESLMASKYLDEWKKEQEKMCDFLKENATSEDFDDFKDMVERLNRVMTDEVSEEFNSTKSFLYFGLYARFRNTGEDDKKFIDFVAEFARSLHKKKIDGISYDSLCINPKTGNYMGTKDKNMVCKKIELMETLMNEYLDIDIHNKDNHSDFVKDFCETDLMYSAGMSKDDMRAVAVETLKLVDNKEEAIKCADDANEWLLDIKGSEVAFNKYVLPAIIRFVKYMYDMYKNSALANNEIDSKGIATLDKYLHNGVMVDDVDRNYQEMIACAA